MSNYRPYPKYKPSGVEWLGEVPEGWLVGKIGHLFRESNCTGEPTLPILSVSIHDGISDAEIPEEDQDRKVSRSEDRSIYKVVRKDDLVYNMMRAWQGGFGAAKVDGIVSPAYVVARPKRPILTKFVELTLRTPGAIEEMRRYSRGITDFRLRLYWDEFRGIDVPAPPELEQQAILAFLDRECGKLDALQAKQERLIELLKEKRQALISHAVTKGLDPTAKLKPSGIEWLGEVPEHWIVGALKHRWLVLDCKHMTATFVADGIPLASIGEVRGWKVDLTNAKGTTEEDYLALIGGGRKPNPGDILFTRNATVGEASLVPPGLKFAMGQDVCLLRKLGEFSSEYLLHVLKSRVVTDQLAQLMIGSTFKRVNVEEIRGLMIPVPPLAEQRAIVAHLDEKCGKIDQLKAKAERGIELLKERRSALISAAVTGKIDVREM